jgi:RHS repeat-associated protein
MTDYRRIALALLATTALIAPSVAQAATPAPKFTTIDDHGVDLVNALPFMSLEEGGIGSGPGRVSMQRIYAEGAGWQDNWTGGLYRVGTKVYILFAGISDTFTQSGSTYTSDKGDGATLIVDGSGYYIYTSRDGIIVKFEQEPNSEATVASFNCPGADPATCRVPINITAPSGLKFSLNWTRAFLCYNVPEPCSQIYIYRRLNTVTSSAGYKLTLAYATNNKGSGTTPPDAWFQRTSVTFDNTANHPSPLPTISYSYGVNTIDVTDPASRTWRFTTNGSGQLTGIRRPGSGSDNVSYTYTSGLVTASTKDGVANSYSRSVVGTTGTMTVTNPLSETNVIVSDLSIGRPTSFQDGLSHTTSYQYDSSARLTRVTQSEGNYAQLAYDARGNVTTVTRVAKSGSGLSNIVTSASFDSTCTNVVKCNQPNTTTDAKGNVTDYTYNTTHGGVTSIKLPAPTGGADRPETRISYTQVTSATGDLVYMTTGSSACASGVAPACVGTASETKASASYNSNLLPTSISRGDGTGALTATSAMTYDARGNLLTVDGPLSGTADTTAFKYDAADQRIGTISPDPDGAGSLPNRAIRLTYRSDGQVSKQELGTSAGQSDSAFNAMAVAQTVDIGFDSNSRPVTAKLSASGTAYALTQTSYDSLGRVDCLAVRMNPAIYGSLPSSACTLGTQGSFGPDRISQNVYDAADQVTQLKVAVGTSDSATERTLTYSNNGMLTTLKDGENNLTTFTYDGFDRLSQTQYPSTTKGSGTSNASDYEQLSYDANGNATSLRLRDGSSIGLSYDNLNRVTSKDLPGSEPDVTFGYDNLGRTISASQTGNSLAFTYDALGRKLTEVGPQGTATSEWDLAGRRTKLTYPGTGLYVNTDYLVTGEVTAIRENGATSGVGVLATYGYDNLGNRTSITFGNGAVQNYTYDNVSRLASLTNNLSGTSNDLSATFAYNPASQIVSTVRTGDAYAFTGYVNGSTATTTNGLNQQVSIGGSAATWDSKGNLTSDPTTSKTYGYSSQNQLTSATGGVTLAYDPAMRLYQVAGAATTRFAYDGLDTLADYDGSNVLQHRYVFGPGPSTGSGQGLDEPIVAYDSSGNRSFLGSDERGSIISSTDSSGTLVNLNRYDEYGRPQAGNAGRFQYTGQRWLSEAGLYDYKARNYLPHLGIFAQTDPVGYNAGANLYPYVLNDPVNLGDPLGLLGVGPGCVQLYHYVTYYRDKNHNGKLDPGDEIVSQEKTPAGSYCPDSAGGSSSGHGRGGGGGGGIGSPYKPNQQCVYRNTSGQCVYDTDKNGNLVFSREYQRQVCIAYDQMARSNNEVAAASYVFNLFGWKFKIPGPALIMDSIAQGVTTALSFAPKPPGC